MTDSSERSLPEALEVLDAQVTQERKADQRRRLALAVAKRRTQRPLLWSLAGVMGVAAAAVLIMTGPASVLPTQKEHAARLGSSLKAPVALAVEAPVPTPVAAIADPVPAPAATDALELQNLGKGLRVAVRQGSRVSGRRLSGSRFQVSVEDGAVELGTASPRAARASWVVLAGQYRLEARGAQFRVDYAASERELQISVIEGKVRVLAPNGQVRQLLPGESWQATAPAVRVSTGRSSPPDEQHPADWRELYLSGKYTQAWNRAKEQGLESGNGLGADALADLADAARLARFRVPAMELLNELRSQYSGSASARDAAFLLGRLASEQPSGADAARAWFQTYLRESPRGSYAQESMGRLLTFYQAEADSAATRNLAERYLTQFPGGPYSALARALSR